MPGLLFLHSGDRHARRVFEHEKRGDWSRALPLVLEKHGYLAFESHDVAAFDPRLLPTFDCALITRLPADAWSAELTRALAESGRPALLERPAAAGLHDRLGISSIEPRPHDALRLLGFSAELRAEAAALGRGLGGRLEPDRTRFVERDPSIDWRSLPDVPLTEAVADRWAARPWGCESWSVASDADVLSDWIADGNERRPAIVRRGRLYASSFDLLAALGYAHTAPPWGPGEFRSSPRTLELEHLLLTIVDLMYRDAGAVRARVRPWPSGHEWALTVRHDFDRAMSARRVAAVVDRHSAAGTAATWYWRARHLGGSRPVRWLSRENRRAVRVVAEAADHEVALHTERLWAGAAEELALLETTIGTRPLGTTAHGDPTCFRFQGAPNVLWAERHGLLYTELIQHGHMHPHRFAALDEDGLVVLLNVICLPHHESLDRSARGGDANVDRLAAAAGRFATVGGMLQVMNHPDINQSELFEVLEGYPIDGRLDLTAAQAATWWRASHTERLSVVADGAGGFRLRSVDGVRDLSVELAYPDGERSIETVSLPPADVVVIHTGR